MTISIRTKYNRLIFHDDWQPTRKFQRGDTGRHRGWIFKLPGQRGGVWFMPLRGVDYDWAHRQPRPEASRTRRQKLLVYGGFLVLCILTHLIWQAIR